MRAFAAVTTTTEWGRVRISRRRVVESLAESVSFELGGSGVLLSCGRGPLLRAGRMDALPFVVWIDALSTKDKKSVNEL